MKNPFLHVLPLGSDLVLVERIWTEGPVEDRRFLVNFYLEVNHWNASPVYLGLELVLPEKFQWAPKRRLSIHMPAPCPNYFLGVAMPCVGGPMKDKKAPEPKPGKRADDRDKYSRCPPPPPPAFNQTEWLNDYPKD